MKNILTLCLIIIISISCTKEDPKEPAAELYRQFALSETEFEQSFKFLKREISYYATNRFLKHIRIFSYDAANRCTEIKIGAIDSSITNPVFKLTQTITFNYEGSAVLPSSLSNVRTVFPNLITQFYFKYNSQGMKIRDSVRVINQLGEPADRTVKYEYVNERVYSTPVMNGFPMVNNSYDTLELLSGGNIERLVSKHIRTTGEELVTYQFTYDDGVSPYNKLNIANSLYFENSAIGLGYNVPLETHYMGVTTNNMTSWMTGSYKINFNYEYDMDKYPLRKEMIRPGDTSPYQVVLFEY